MVAGDFAALGSHHVNMEPSTDPDWYLHEWFATLGHKQHDLVSKLDYPKNTAHRLWHGLQPFRRDHVATIAAFLNIKPHELLMPPEEAMRIRRLEAAIKEVASPEPATQDRQAGDTPVRRRGAA